MTIPDDTASAALARWLEPRLPGATGLVLEQQGSPGSGFSAQTTILSARWTDASGPREDRFVLRQETPDPPVYPVQVPGLDVEIELQHRIMTALLQHTDLQLAPVLGYEPDSGVLGMPFFVMGFVDGLVPIESPMYTLEGFFTELAPERRTAMVEDGVRQLAAVHAVDWQAAGLGWLVPEGAEPTVERQLDVWQEYAGRELRGREHPLLERAWTWLRAEVPTGSAPALCWGDPRLGNVIWRDEKALCLTDFEAAHVAPPEVDLGWWLMFDRWAHETSGVTERAPGDPTREQQKALYEQLTGRTVGDTAWFEVFAAARYAAIVVRVMNRWADRGDLPADHTIWIDNPVTPLLTDLVAEAGA